VKCFSGHTQSTLIRIAALSSFLKSKQVPTAPVATFFILDLHKMAVHILAVIMLSYEQTSTT